MQLIAFILIYPILWLISILPFKLLYLLSNVVAFLLRDVLRYRKSVIVSNLKLVFPEKSEQEIKSITSKFYSHLCDLFLEMIKTLSISKKSLNKRFIIKNPEVLKQLDNANTSAILMFGHYASYEWSTVIQSHISLPGLVIYKTLRNKYFDQLVHRIRSKYNTELVNTKKTKKTIEVLATKKDHRIIAFLSDQSPKLNVKSIWLPFMGFEVPCFFGAENTAKKFNYPVGFLQIDKVKRGYYEAEFIIITDNPSTTKPLEITKKFNQLLEAQIKKRPEFYLWTHKRWKHRGKKPKES